MMKALKMRRMNLQKNSSKIFFNFSKIIFLFQKTSFEIPSDEILLLQEKRNPMSNKLEFDEIIIESSMERPQTHSNLKNDYSLKEKLVNNWRNYVKKDKLKMERKIIYQGKKISEFLIIFQEKIKYSP